MPDRLERCRNGSFTIASTNGTRDHETGVLVAAACLAALLAGAHSYLGERYILTRLFRTAELPRLLGGVEFTRNTLRFAWHITSIAWLGLAGLIVVVASPSAVGRQAEARVIAATFAVSGIVALAASRGRHLSWVAFFGIALLVWFGHP